jgi:DNA uptake protein ComE-like DNA-binding protein
MEPTEKINLNMASSKHLTGLPGITIDVARRIVAFRKRHGGMIHDWEELLNVNGFPGDRIEEIKARAILVLPSGQKEAVEGEFLHHFPGQLAGRKTKKP